MKKNSPISKIYEAYSALSDGRVKKKDENTYLVLSSDKTKTYTVKTDGFIYSSNDNATYWQHYCGYPVVAVIMLEGKVFSDKTIFPYFTKVNWHELNRKHKNKYDLAIQEFLSDKDKGVKDRIIQSTEKTSAEINALDIQVKGNREKIILP